MTACDVCGEPIIVNPHEPHSPSCPRIIGALDDCDCDWQVCPACCWTPECHEAAS